MNSIKKLIFFLCALFAISTDLLASSVSPATKNAEETLATLISTHPLIVLGIVGPKEDAYYGTYPAFPQEQAVILSDVKVKVQKVLQGNLLKKTLLIQTLGGCIKADDLCFQTDLSPSLFQGSQVILFLRPGQGEKWIVWDTLSGVQVYSDGLFYPLAMDLATIEVAIKRANN